MSKGNRSSRMRACAEMAESAVPAIEIPKLARKNTSTSQCSTDKTGTLYIVANNGRRRSSVSRRKSVFAVSFARKMAKGSLTESLKELRVSLCCSRRKQGCSIKEEAKRNASQRSPGAKRRDSSEVGSNVKLNRTITIRMNTIVVASNSRERNSVRSSLSSKTAALGSRLIQASAKVRMERKVAPVRVSATTEPASSLIARVPSEE